MAKWGLILNVAVPLLIVIVAFGVIAMGSVGGTDRSPWSSVAVGQCLAPSDATSVGAGIFAPERTACRDEHWSQVYYVGTIVGGSQSRDAAVMQQVKGMCTSREALARLDSARIADLYPTIIEPDDDSWAANERWVECLASDADGSITGSWLNGS